MITLRHDNLPPIAVSGRAEELVALVVSHANRINAMHYGSVEVHFGQGGHAQFWIRDCLTDKPLRPSSERATLAPVNPHTGDVE